MVQLVDISLLDLSNVPCFAHCQKREKLSFLRSVSHFLLVTCLSVGLLVLESEQRRLTALAELMQDSISVRGLDSDDFSGEIYGQSEVDGGLEPEFLREGHLAPLAPLASDKWVTIATIFGRHHIRTAALSLLVFVLSCRLH